VSCRTLVGSATVERLFIGGWSICTTDCDTSLGWWLRKRLWLSLTSDADFAVLHGEEVQECEARAREARSKRLLGRIVC
jgi:hypothetical protein